MTGSYLPVRTDFNYPATTAPAPAQLPTAPSRSVATSPVYTAQPYLAPLTLTSSPLVGSPVPGAPRLPADSGPFVPPSYSPGQLYQANATDRSVATDRSEPTARSAPFAGLDGTTAPAPAAPLSSWRGFTRNPGAVLGPVGLVAAVLVLLVGAVLLFRRKRS